MGPRRLRCAKIQIPQMGTIGRLRRSGCDSSQFIGENDAFHTLRMCGGDENNPFSWAAHASVARCHYDTHTATYESLVSKPLPRTRKNFPKRWHYPDVSDVVQHNAGVARPDEVDVPNRSKRRPRHNLYTGVVRKNCFIQIAVTPGLSQDLHWRRW